MQVLGAVESDTPSPRRRAAGSDGLLDAAVALLGGVILACLAYDHLRPPADQQVRPDPTVRLVSAGAAIHRLD